MNAAAAWSMIAGKARRHALEIGVLFSLYTAFFVVHDVRDWVGAPYWLDETWVALSTRVPLGDLPRVTSSTPIGWTSLLRAVPVPDALRLIPLGFALLTVAAAYAFGRLLPWRTRIEAVIGGGLAAGVVVLLPAAQFRHDLKQYTADAALTFTLLALAEWADRAGTRRPLVLLAAAGPVAFLFSSVAALVTAAAFGGLVLGAALRRDRSAVVTRIVAGAASGLGLVAFYAVFVGPNRVPVLVDFWRDYYPAPADLPGYVHAQLRQLAVTSGFGRWWVWLPVVAGGVAVIALMRRTATMITLLLLPVIAVVLGLLKAYPLLDDRTSYHLIAVGAALSGTGFARAATEIARRVPALRWQPLLAAALAMVAVGGFAVTNRSWYRYDETIMNLSDIRTQVRWVDERRAPGDIVVITRGSRYGYLFYHDDQPMRWTESSSFAHGWDAILPSEPNFIELDGVTLEIIRAAVERAVAQARSNGPGARVFIIRTAWWNYGEPEAWATVLADYEVTYPYTGPEPVAIIAPSPRP